MPIDPARRCNVTLACVRAHVGRGEGGGDREDVIWEREGLATARRSAGGTRLAFRFEVPADSPESEPESANYRRWIVRLRAPMRGTDLDRDFIIPVFETGGQRAQWRQANSHAELLEAAPAEPPRRLLRLGQEGAATVLRYPPLRNPGVTLGVAIFAAIFLDCGFFWLYVGGGFSTDSAVGAAISVVMMPVIGIILLVGAGLAAAALYMLGNTLVARAGPDEIATVRRLFGVPISRQRLAANHLLSIASETGMRSGRGVRSRKYERLLAKGSGGRKIVIGDGIDDAATAELVRRAVAEACGLKGEAAPGQSASAAFAEI